MVFDHFIDGTRLADVLDDSIALPGETSLIRGLGGDDEITATSALTVIDGGGRLERNRNLRPADPELSH